jgi:hypothetical protein
MVCQRPQTLLDEALAEAFDCCAPDSECRGHGLIFPAIRRCEQDAGARDFAGRVYPPVQQVFKLLAFIVSKRDTVFFLGNRWSSSWL